MKGEDVNFLIFMICVFNCICFYMGCKYGSKTQIIRIKEHETMEIFNDAREEQEALRYNEEPAEQMTSADEIYYDQERIRTARKYGRDINDI